ncbi:hypothetical protein V8F20_009246 [Naviculisporaceae sp. PSN 640]
MVSFTTLAITALATLAAARNCTPGLRYCGKTLRAIATGDNYNTQIREAYMELTGISFPSQEEENDTLFHCLGGDNGDIVGLQVCPISCRDNGNGRSDECSVQ